jgi:hypothetical protein
MLYRSALRAARFAGNVKTAANTAKVKEQLWVEYLNQLTYIIQRSASSSTKSEASSYALTATGCAATAVAIGSLAWYQYAFADELHAMTPAEEG